MKKIIIFSLIIFIYSNAFSQRNFDIGAFGGTSYYLGELNPVYIFSSPRYAVGPIIRYSFNPRYSLRTHAIFANIAGADIESNQYITKRNYPVSFSSNIINISSQVEFNFFKFKSYEDKGAWSPYIFGGMGYSIVLTNNSINSAEPSRNHLTIPFGVGAKLNLTRRMSAGLEWSHYKTFNSQIDGVVSPVGETFLFRNDWYSFFGLFITYKFFKFAADCPVYD